jgi:AcrR family transcriptional regulator
VTAQLATSRRDSSPPRRPGASLSRAKPLRRDAEQNLTRILASASEVFAQRGYEASMEEIAEKAEVGVGTLYRRFPSKADLVKAVVEAANRRTEEVAASVLADCSPADGVFEFLRRCVATPSCWRVIVSRAPGIGDTPRHGITRIAPLVELLLENGKKAGEIRPDVVFSDLAVALMAVRAVADLFDPVAASTSGRYLELVMAALRPDGHAWQSPAMTTRQLGEVLSGR